MFQLNYLELISSRLISFFRRLGSTKRLHPKVVDSCSSTVIGSRRIMEVIFKTNCSLNSYGFIGPGANNQMRSILDMTSAFNITQTSYGIMESDILDKQDRYPFFKNVRTSAKVMIELVCTVVSQLDWDYISISVTTHDILNVNLCESAGVDMSLSVLLRHNIYKGVQDLTSPYKNLKDTRAPRVTVMLGDMPLTDIIIFADTLAAGAVTTPHIWLISEQFLLAYVDLFNKLPKFENQMFICYHSPSKAGNGTSRDLCPACSTGPCPDCSLAQNISRKLDLKFFISLGVDEIINSPGESHILRGQSDNVQLLYLDSDTADLIKIAGTVQDDIAGTMVELNEAALEETGINALRPSICSPGCTTGQYYITRAGEPKSCFHCKDCHLLREVSYGMTKNCTVCQNDMKPNANNSACVSIQPEPEHYRTAMGIVLMICSMGGITCVLLTFWVFAQNKSTPIIRAASRELCYVIFVGLILSFTSVVFMMLKPGAVICRLQITLLCFGSSLTITTILGRAIRIIRIFTATNVTLDTLLVSLRHQTVFISLIVLLQTSLALCASFSITAELYVDDRPISEQLQPKVYEMCSQPHRVLIWVFLGIFLALCLVTSFLSFQARKLPTNYNQVTYTYFTVFTMDIIISAFLAIQYAGGEGALYPPGGEGALYNRGRTGGRSIVPAAIVTVLTGYLILFLLFFNKVYIIYFRPDQNKIHNIPESPTLKLNRHRRESERLVQDRVSMVSFRQSPGSPQRKYLQTEKRVSRIEKRISRT